MHHFSSEGNQDGAEAIQKVPVMREEYDFSQSMKNPYTKHLRKPVTIPLGLDVISYFNDISEETGIPYQSIINLYLKDCMQSHRRLSFTWAS